MRKPFIKAGLIVLSSLFMTQCAEEEELLNHQRFAVSENAILYQAPKNSSISVESAWTPTAIAPYTTQSFLYLDAGTRQVVELSYQNHERTILMDLSGYERKLHQENMFNSDWGSSLLQGTDGWYLVAAPKHSILWFNAETGEVRVIGHSDNAGIPANNGIMISETDFRDFSGIGKSKSGLYISFKTQIYHLNLSVLTPDAFSMAKLEHIAGSFSQENSDTHDALHTFLNLSKFTHYLEVDGRLIFWEPPNLRMIYQNQIQTITGNGNRSSAEIINTFYAYDLPMSPKPLFYNGYLYTPYGSLESTLLKIDLNDISMSSDHVHGTIEFIKPNVGIISDWIQIGNDFITTDSEIGNFHRINAKDPKQNSLIFGPATSEERFNILYNQDSAKQTEILAPLAIAPMMSNKMAIVYEPTLERMHILNLESFQSTPIWNGKAHHLVTDNHKNAWFTNNRTFYFLTIEENGELSFSYVPSFFRQPHETGYPCNRQVFHLTETPHISLSGDNLLMWMTNSNLILQYDLIDDLVSMLHHNGWVIPDITYPQYYSNNLATGLIQFWTANRNMEAMILNYDHQQYLTIANLKKKQLSIANHQIPKEKVKVISGFGKIPIQNNLAADDTLLDSITSLYLTFDNKLFIVSDRHVYQLTDDGIWSENTICPIPETVNEVEEFSQQTIYDQIFCSAKFDGIYHLYSPDAVYFNDISLEHQWQPIISDSLTICNSTALAVYTNDQQLCITSLSENSAQYCTQLPADANIHEIVCDNEYIYLSGSDGKNDQIWQMSYHISGKINPYLGAGIGLPDETQIQKALLGTNPAGIQSDSVPNLYFWMKDTCTIWKLPAQDTIEGDTPVFRWVTDDILCHADAFAVKPDGEIAIIYNQALYILNDQNEFVFKTNVMGTVLDMMGMGQAFVWKSTDGLFSWEDNILRHHHASSMIIGNEIIDYAVQGDVWPGMMQSPGENGLIIPIFSQGKIVKVKL